MCSCTARKWFLHNDSRANAPKNSLSHLYFAAAYYVPCFEWDRRTQNAHLHACVFFSFCNA